MDAVGDHAPDPVGRPDAKFLIHIVHPRAESCVKYERRIRVRPVVLFCKAADERDRELQAFTGMHRHDPDFIAALPRTLGKSEVHLALSEFFDIPYKMKQTAVAGLLIGDRLVHQQIQIGPLLPASL